MELEAINLCPKHKTKQEMICLVWVCGVCYAEEHLGDGFQMFKKFKKGKKSEPTV